MSRFERVERPEHEDRFAERLFNHPVLYSLKTALVRSVAGALTPLWFRNYFDPIEVALSGLQGQKLLEIGSGSGYLYEHIRKRNLQIEYVGSDVNPHMVAHCQEKYPDRRWMQLSALPYPFADNEFDVVLIWNVIHHLNDYEDVLTVLSEAIRMGSRVIMFEPLQSSPRLLHAIKALHWKITDGGKYYFTRDEWQKVFDRIGAEVVWERKSEPLHQIILAEIRTKKLHESVIDASREAIA